MAEALPGLSGGETRAVKRSATGWPAWSAEQRRERQLDSALTLRRRRCDLIPGVGFNLSFDDWPATPPDACDYGGLRLRGFLFGLRKPGQSDADPAVRARGNLAGAAWSDHRRRRRSALPWRAPRHRRGGEFSWRAFICFAAGHACARRCWWRYLERAGGNLARPLRCQRDDIHAAPELYCRPAGEFRGLRRLERSGEPRLAGNDSVPAGSHCAKSIWNARPLRIHRRSCRRTRSAYCSNA